MIFFSYFCGLRGDWTPVFRGAQGVMGIGEVSLFFVCLLWIFSSLVPPREDQKRNFSISDQKSVVPETIKGKK